MKKLSFTRPSTRWLLPAALALLGGCAAGPDYVRPAVTLPTAYLAADGAVPSPADQPSTGAPAHQAQSTAEQSLLAGADVPARWWEAFQSPALNQLIEASLRSNPTVAAAQAALHGALENVAAQEGSYYPSVNASFTPTRQKVAGVLSSPLASNAYYYNLHTAQVSVAYTPDLFGANRRQVESLAAQADAQRYQLQATYLTLTANVANAAIGEAALRGQVEATRAIIAAQTRVMDAVRQQRALGQLADADVAAQEAALAASAAALPPLEKQLAQQRNLLAALAGDYPQHAPAQQFTLDALVLPDSLPLTLPSQLAERRPDVRAAEEQLHAASAGVGIAAANRLPNITLGVNAYGSSASSLGGLFKAGTGFWTLAGSVVQPVFDAGTLKHRQGAAQAAYDEAAAQYRSTVITAFQNVADALQAIHYDAQALQTAALAEQAAARSVAIGRRQLALGDVSALTVLAQEQAWQQARLALVQAQAGRLADSVALYQALGGSPWPATQ